MIFLFPESVSMDFKKFVSSFLKVYPNRSLYLHTFLRKTPWKLYDPFITFRLQMWRMNYLNISKSFWVCLWNIFENITGMPLRGHLLAILYIFDSCQIRNVRDFCEPVMIIPYLTLKNFSKSHFIVGMLYLSLIVLRHNPSNEHQKHEK